MRKTNKKWEIVLLGGKRRFILRFGIFGWGISAWVLVIILRSTFGIHFDLNNSRVFVALISLPLFLVGGYFWGLLMWWYMERMHGNPASRLNDRTHG